MSTSRHSRLSNNDESSMSSLSAGLSAYNAAEPKPMSSGNSRTSTRHSSYAPGPPPPRPGGNGSVAQSYRSQPRSVESHSAQSVRSALSHGSAGRRRGSDGYDDEQSTDTARLVGLVNDLTGNQGGDTNSEMEREHERHRLMEEERFQLQEQIRNQIMEDGSHGNGSRGNGSHATGSHGNGSHGNYHDDGRSSARGSHRSRRSVDPEHEQFHQSSRSSMDPDARSVGAPPPPPRSVHSTNGSRRSGMTSNRTDPTAMTHEFGADDPDGRHYAPGLGRQPPRGPPSVASRGSRSLPPPVELEEESVLNEPSIASRSRMSRSYFGADESIPEEESYYSRDSRGSSHQSSVGSMPSHPRLSAEASQFSGMEDEDMSRDMSASHVKEKKAKPMPKVQVNKNKRCMWWYNFSRCVTICVPDRCIRKDDSEAKQAWREKVAICFIVFLVSGFFVGIFGFIPVMLCQERMVYTLSNVQERTNEQWIVVNGYVYDVVGLLDKHPTGPAGIEAFMHDDASMMFPRVPPASLPPMCLNQAKFEDNKVLQNTKAVCVDMTDEDRKNGLPCHDFVTGIEATAKYLGEFEKGVLAHDGVVLNENPYTFWVSIHERVYNVTDYVNSIRNEQTKQIVKDHPNAYLEPTLNNLVVNKLNEDATELFMSVYPDDRILGCMDELFYVGIIDTRFDVICFVLNIIMYFLLCFVAFIMIAQMFCSLMYIAKGTRTYSAEDTQDQVIVMVPCYNEGGTELIKTIDSVLMTSYPEENKMIFVICDGNVTGAGELLSSPEHLAEILGFEIDAENDEMYEYNSIGLLTTNRARVYHGYYEQEDKSLKYLVVVKAGLAMELAGSAKPGNRGKRDSQLVLMGFFNRIYHGRELNELDAAIEDAMIDLNMQSDDMRLLMTIDADTRVEELAITHMAYSLNQNERILALCGETKVDNKWQTWCTMMQVFEYYNNHHMKKAFEAAFGCVTCLPGCFTMYRILNDDGKPLISDDRVYAEYLRNDIDSLHEQNLYHLGEDRMLTTLLLHFFPDMFLTYVPEAQCWTIVPHTLKILLSQRRRWINSTYHNLLELTKVKTMCGVCCCSMKTVVYLDLIACMILPASTVYAVYLIFLVAVGKTKFSVLLLVLYGMIVGVQIIVFIFRSRWDFFFWFIFFTIVGVPVFYFILPLYAFAHMDDFSWGETRKVAAMTKSFETPAEPTQLQTVKEDDSTDSDDDEDSRKSYDDDSKRSYDDDNSRRSRGSRSSRGSKSSRRSIT